MKSVRNQCLGCDCRACSRFWFDKEIYSAKFLKDRGLLKFLNNYGPDIQELSFMCESFNRSQAKEKQVIDFVTNLLLHQTPNLSKLEIVLEYSVSWAEGGPTRKWDSTLLATDPEFKEIHSKTWETNSKLKVLSLFGVSAKLLEVVIQLAPNLREITAQGRDSIGIESKYFVEPLNRLKHLKKIQFQPDSIEDFEVFENICELTQSVDTRLKLREFSFGYNRDFDQNLWAAQDLFESHDMRVRGENVLNRLLECSGSSLETIKWDPSTGLLGLKWPEELPNVQKLTMSTVGDRVFPNGFSWSTTFPNLRSLSLYDTIGQPNFTNVMDLLFRKQKVESVKDIHVHAEDDWSKTDRLTAAQLKRLQNIFPNAEIELAVPFSRLFKERKLHIKAVQNRCMF